MSGRDGGGRGKQKERGGPEEGRVPKRLKKRLGSETERGRGGRGGAGGDREKDHFALFEEEECGHGLDHIVRSYLLIFFCRAPYALIRDWL